MSSGRGTDHARALRRALTDVRAVCERLGLLSTRGSFHRQHGGLLIRCPWHDDRTPSCSVRLAGDGTIAVRCHGCGATGDVLSLIAAARGLSLRTEFRSVLLAAAELSGSWSIAHELGAAPIVADRPLRPAPPPPPPDRDYPPQAEVEELWGQCAPATDDADVALVLLARGLDPELVAAEDLARVLPRSGRTPRWAAYRGRSWCATGHRLLVRMRDAKGTVRTVRAWRVTPGDSPKRLPPAGHKASGVVMADHLAIALLAGAAPITRVILVEGESDWLTWATRRKPHPTATMGIVSGSFTPALAQRFPLGATVLVRTDHDQAGERYAREIHAALRRRCFVRRGAMT